MRIDVVGRQFEVTDAIRQYAETKAAKLTKYYDGVQSMTVSIGRASSQHSAEYVVELVLDVEHHDDFVTHAKAADPYAGIDLVCEKGERQLRDFKERLKPGKHDRKGT
jgi:putative sigma-54 modulation protein